MAAQPIGYLLGAGTRPLPLIEGGVVTLGRDQQNTIVVEDATASRNHACIECQERAVVIQDLGSSNGTYVNDVRLAKGERFALRSDDKIRIGSRIFHFISAAAGLEPREAARSQAREMSQMQTMELHFEGGVPAVPQAPTPQPPAAPEATQPRPAADADAAATLAGSLSEGGLPQIMQFLHSGTMTGKLSVNCPQLQGSMLFLNGALYAATAAAASGDEAVYAFALAREGRFSFARLDSAQVESSARNITGNTMQIIIECCRRMDEAASSSPQ